MFIYNSNILIIKPDEKEEIPDEKEEIPDEKEEIKNSNKNG